MRPIFNSLFEIQNVGLSFIPFILNNSTKYYKVKIIPKVKLNFNLNMNTCDCCYEQSNNFETCNYGHNLCSNCSIKLNCKFCIFCNPLDNKCKVLINENLILSDRTNYIFIYKYLFLIYCLFYFYFVFYIDGLFLIILDFTYILLFLNQKYLSILFYVFFHHLSIYINIIIKIFFTISYLN